MWTTATMTLTTYITCNHIASSRKPFLQCPSWLRHTAEVVRKGFKEQYRWWATVELGRRILLLLSVVAFPGKYVSLFYSKVITTNTFKLQTIDRWTYLLYWHLHGYKCYHLFQPSIQQYLFCQWYWLCLGSCNLMRTCTVMFWSVFSPWMSLCCCWWETQHRSQTTYKCCHKTIRLLINVLILVESLDSLGCYCHSTISQW